MIYNPLNKKKYCLTSCAKDKIETYILKPIAVIITGAILLFCLVVLLTIIGAVSFLVGLFLFNTYYLPKESLLITGVLISAIALVLFVFTMVMLEVFDALNTKIDTWVSTPYQARKKCMIFRECD